jgi:serine/threonine protein phosphatase PrpC
MGTYLSTPVTEKHSEEGESMEYCDANKKAIRHVAWGVVDMQGWRKSMEDSHVTQTNVPSICIPVEAGNCNSNETPSAHVFGVFDGHGGPEVARFCALYIVSVLQQLIQQLMCSSSKEINVNEIMGKALKDTFHALDRLIDDPSKKDELMKLRVLAPPRTEQRVADFIPPPLPILQIPETNVPDVATKDTPHNTVESTVTPLITVDSSTTATSETPSMEDSEESKESNDDFEDEEDADSLDNPKEGLEEACMLDQDMSNDDEDEVVEQEAHVDILPVSTSITSSSEHPEDPAFDSNDTVDDDHAFMTSIHVAMNEADSENAATTIASTTSTTTTVKSTSSVNKVAGMFQRLLKFNGSSGQLVLQLGSSHSGKVASTIVSAKTQSTTTIIQKSDTVVTVSPPSVVRNGQLMCNLSDHPIHAGATAIVAVMVGRMLTIANAGDSRAVLARGAYGVMALSLDHKPSQQTELRRIVNAGGFVNAFGRINGNLNLSRSIGDLKYKQVKHLPPAQQMITAEPDIVQLRIFLLLFWFCRRLCMVSHCVSSSLVYRVELQDDDEFILLGCDGIWDCLTNEKAVEYVRTRIDDFKPTEIGKMMLNAIISTDPRTTQGIGGDNMTILIIDLQPTKRRYYHQELNSTSATTNPTPPNVPSG